MNLNRRQAIRLARSLGCDVHPPNRTGELVFSHPLLAWHVRTNGRRKDTSRELMQFLREVRRLAGQNS